MKAVTLSSGSACWPQQRRRHGLNQRMMIRASASDPRVAAMHHVRDDTLSRRRSLFLSAAPTAAVMAARPALADGEDSTKESKATKKVVRRLYGEFVEGDLREILELMADDVQVWSAWKGAGQSYTGTGKEGVEGYFRFTEAALDIDRTKFSVLKLVADRKDAFALVSSTFTSKRTGNTRTTWMVHRYVVEDGKVRKFEEYIDTALLAAEA